MMGKGKFFRSSASAHLKSACAEALLQTPHNLCGEVLVVCPINYDGCRDVAVLRLPTFERKQTSQN